MIVAPATIPAALEVVLLPARPSILAERPLDIGILVLEGTHHDGKGPHGEARTDFAELDRLVSCADVDVMANLDAIILVHECDDAVPFVLLRGGVPWWEQMLQDLDDTCAKGCCEAVEDEMGIAF